MTAIHVVYTCDRNLFACLAVSVGSLARTLHDGPDRDRFTLDLTIVEIGFTESDKEALRRIVAAVDPRYQLTFVNYQLQRKLERCPYPYAEIVTLVYYLPELLPHLDRVIFLDADTLVLRSIAELWELDLEGHWIATTPAVLDDESLERYHSVTEGRFWSAEQTINAGVMIFDLRRMAAQGVTKVLDEWTTRHQEKLHLPEQEAIAFNYPTRKLIDHRWNWRGPVGTAEPYWAARTRATREAYSRIEPALVHLQSPTRPDRVIINSKYFDLWNDCYDRLGLPPLQPRKVPPDLFFDLMTEDKRRLRWKHAAIIALLNLPWVLLCLLHYVRYLRDPHGFVFPTFPPGRGEPPRAAGRAPDARPSSP